MSSGAQMLAGGVLLAVTAAALGELHDFHPRAVSREAWLSLLYLIVAGSIVAFTAYVWLIHHASPTKVGTYAYVNPVVAVLVGYFLGGESLGLRTILGTLCVLISVVVITTTRAKEPLATLPVGDHGPESTAETIERDKAIETKRRTNVRTDLLLWRVLGDTREKSRLFEEDAMRERRAMSRRLPPARCGPTGNGRRILPEVANPSTHGRRQVQDTPVQKGPPTRPGVKRSRGPDPAESAPSFRGRTMKDLPVSL